MGVHSIKIQNFKSIRESDDIEIKPINVLIGPNGAGKSNFISFFKFLNKLYKNQLQLYISQQGRSDNILYFGLKNSDFLCSKIVFNNDWKNEYEFKMVPDQDGNLIFSEEWSNYTDPASDIKNKSKISIGGNAESEINTDDEYRNRYLKSQFSSFKLFHFHDTSFNSKIKQPCSFNDYAYLHADGSNLAAFLYRLSKTSFTHFRMIEKVVESIAPFFDKFYLEPDDINANQIYLRWFEKGYDKMFNAHSLSDGTLRMIALTTLLLQPDKPDTIIIDEPELGLHSFAINKLASMIKIASEKSQIIVSTQSVNFVNEFDADDIIVVEREGNQTVLRRQSNKELTHWLSDYSLGELWQSNVLGGRP